MGLDRTERGGALGQAPPPTRTGHVVTAHGDVVGFVDCLFLRRVHLFSLTCRGQALKSSAGDVRERERESSTFITSPLACHLRSSSCNLGSLDPVVVGGWVGGWGGGTSMRDGTRWLGWPDLWDGFQERMGTDRYGECLCMISSLRRSASQVGSTGLGGGGVGDREIAPIPRCQVSL